MYQLHLSDVISHNHLVCALILTRIDYCNAMFAGLPDSTLVPLQRVFHAAAHFVNNLRPRDNVTATLMLLHWLPVRQRITYKLCSLMHRIVYRHEYAWCSWILNWYGCASIPPCSKMSPTFSARWPFRRTTITDGVWFESFLHRCTTSLESTACWHSQHCHMFNL